MSRLVTYQSDQIPGIWPYVKHLIERAEPYGDLTASKIYQGLVDGRFQLWTSQCEHVEAAVVTTIEASREACWLLAAGGRNMRTWIKWLPIVEQWAKEEGCKELKIQGRPGWARAAGFEIANMVRKI